MLFKKFKPLSYALAFCLAGAGSVSASSLSLEYVSSAAGYRLLQVDESPTIPAGSTSLPADVYAGAFVMRDTTPNSVLGTFIAWCLDLSNWLGASGEHPYHITDTPFSNSYGLDADQQARVASFFDANYYDGLADNRDRSAGFQMGLWEVLYDDDFDLVADTSATDDFRGQAGNSNSIAAFNLAGDYLTAAQNYDGGKKWNLRFLESETGKQNLITVSAVPLPPMALLMLTGMAGFGVMARRRKAKATA